VLLVLQAVVSFRSVPRILALLRAEAGLGIDWVPHFTSVINWTLRVGLGMLRQVAPIDAPWVAIIDHSIDVGTKKALVVLRVPLAALSQRGAAIQLGDCQCVGLTIAKMREIPSSGLREISTAYGLPVVVRLDHRRLSLFRQESREAPLREQLDLAARLGAGYVITHVSPYPMTPRPERRTEVLERLLTGLGFTLGLCADYGLGLHVENTYHNLAFYRGLFSAAADAGLEGAHFCFDLGHGKVWSTQCLWDWLGFLGDLDQAGTRIHFHLHANGGLNDDHLSFPAADHLGMTGPDGYTDPWDSYDAIAEIAARFPASIKVFEVPAGEAIANRDHVLGRIAALARPTLGSLSLDPAVEQLEM